MRLGASALRGFTRAEGSGGRARALGFPRSRKFYLRRYAAHKNTHIIENKIHVAGGISPARPVAHISRTYATIPKANPSEILKHSATIIMQKNTGMSSAGSENFICDMLPNINIPITISAGAVAAAGTAFIRGICPGWR